MKNYIASVLLLTMINVSTGAQAATPAVITVKINHALVEVNLGDRDVSVGDRVAVYKKTCPGGRGQICTKERVGAGTVARVLDDQYSEVNLDPGVQVREGYTIERE